MMNSTFIERIIYIHIDLVLCSLIQTCVSYSPSGMLLIWEVTLHSSVIECCKIVLCVYTAIANINRRLAGTTKTYSRGEEIKSSIG